MPLHQKRTEIDSIEDVLCVMQKFPEDLPIDEQLQIACRDLSPSFNQQNNKARVQKIKKILGKGANPNITDESGQNRLFLLFNCDRSRQAKNIETDLAKNGFRENEVSGERLNYIYAQGRYIYEGDSDYDNFAQDESYNVRQYFRFNEAELNQYQAKITQVINDFKLQIAREIIPCLVGRGIEIDTLNNEGKTALMIADEKGDKILVQALIENGANEFDLKVGNPEYKYLTDWSDRRNIHNQLSNWTGFIISINESVRNRALNKYPWAQLNPADNSVSFFVSTEIDQRLADFNQDRNQNFIKSIDDGYFVEQLKFQSRQMGFKVAGGKDFLEVKPTEMGDLIEYKFNISAENLDSILQLNSTYSGYRNEGGLLKLAKDFSLKPSSIMLWPLQSLDDEGKVFHVMAAGCQTIELPTLQLMQLLPDYESKILPRHKEKGFRFHWIPEDVENELFLDRMSVGEVIKRIFLNNGIKVTEESTNTFYENPDILQIDDSAKMRGVRIVAMDDNAQVFYASYGNIAKEKLEHCASLEVDVITFLEAIKNYHESLVPDSDTREEMITNAKATINLMIEREREKKIIPDSIVELATASVTNSKECCVIS
jgi:ankyrin repeat protein